MNWSCYKRLCDRPEYWSRWMLEQCIELFEQQGETALSAALRAALQQPPLAVPADHRGHAATQMFHLALPAAARQRALVVVQRAAAAGRTTSGTAARGLGGFVEAWREYAASGE